MSKISALLSSAAVLTMLSLGSVVPAAADTPPSKARPVIHNDPQVRKLMQDAGQALRQGNIPLATIQLKNALRLDPDNGSLRVQLGFVLLVSGDLPSGEREIRQGRIDGAKDEEAIPPLLQAMIARGEYSDVLAQFPDPAPGDKSRLAGITLRARAEASQMAGDFAGAVSSMDRALVIQRDASGLLARGRIAILQGQPDAGMTYIDQALKLAPNDVSGLMMKASVVRTHDKVAALAIIDGLLKAHPDSVPANVSRIEMLLDMKRNADAQKTVDYVLSKSPTLPIGLFYKAVLLGLYGKPVDAWRIAQSLPSEFIQSNQRIVIGATQLATAAGNVEIANQMLTTFVGQHQDNEDARDRLGALRMRMNNPGEALEIMKPAMNSTNPLTLQLISQIYAALKQPADSMTYLRKAAAVSNNNPALQFQVAIGDLNQKNTAQGVASLTDLIKKNQSNLQPVAAAIEILLRQGKFSEAQSLADQADTLYPKNPIPAFFKGEILFSQNKRDAALPLINQALQRDAKYVPALFARAQILLAQNKLADSAKDLTLAQSLQPNNQLSYVKLAEIAAIQKQPAQSIAILRQGIAKAPKEIGARLVLARYQITQRQFPDAQATLKAALQVAPNNAQALALLGQVQQATGQKAAALNTNKSLTQKYQQSGAAQALLANSLLANGDKKGAMAALKRATELSPTVQQYFAALSDMQFQAGDKEGAVATARAFATANVGPDGSVMLAGTLVRAGKLADAAAVIAKAEAVRPDWQLTLIDSRIAGMQGNRTRALSVLKNWLDDHSTDLAVRQVYGDTLLLTKNDEAALAQYEIFLKSRNDIPSVLNNTAWLLRDKDPKRALALASKAAQLQPSSSDIADTQGYLLLQAKNPKDALPVLQRAHAAGPGNGQISYHLAMAYNSLGRKADAKKTLQDALAKGATFQDSTEAKKLLQSL